MLLTLSRWWFLVRIEHTGILLTCLQPLAAYGARGVFYGAWAVLYGARAAIAPNIGANQLFGEKVEEA